MSVTLVTQEGVCHEVPVGWLRNMGILRSCAEDASVGPAILPIPHVSSEVLSRVLVWCEYHQSEVMEEEPAVMMAFSEWDLAFIGVDVEDIFQILKVADYLDARGLVLLALKGLADALDGRPVNELRFLLQLYGDGVGEETAQAGLDAEDMVWHKGGDELWAESYLEMG